MSVVTNRLQTTKYVDTPPTEKFKMAGGAMWQKLGQLRKPKNVSAWKLQEQSGKWASFVQTRMKYIYHWIS